jgi:hypothetical protein
MEIVFKRSKEASGITRKPLRTRTEEEMRIIREREKYEL